MCAVALSHEQESRLHHEIVPARRVAGATKEAARSRLSGRCVKAIISVSEVVRKKNHKPEEGCYHEPIEEAAGHSPR